MNLTTNDNPVLVAPRPVRLTAPFPIRTAPVRLVSAPDTVERIDELRISPAVSEKDHSSPRSSPRLPSEALEEFLSILRPAMFPPRSPVMRARKVSSLPAIHHDRSFSFKTFMNAVDEVIESPRLLAKTPEATAEQENTVDFELVDRDEAQALRWFTSSVLASPVSRNNTRNPFQRHASYQISLTPSPSLKYPLSPAAIPLPLPTPDEMLGAL